jgi:hypothetical protein
MSVTELPACHNCTTSFADCWGDDPRGHCCQMCDHSLERFEHRSDIVAVCNLCPERSSAFAVPANPLDRIGAALMRQHLTEAHS